MEQDYWLERWRAGQIGFHRTEVNPLLIEYRATFAGGKRVLVPLCGKTTDLGWLAFHGFEVVGVELSDIAAQAFFSERGIIPKRREQDRFVVYEHGKLAIWVGDFFALSSANLEPFDAVYDDSALIALPAELRRSYAAHLQRLMAPQTAMLLITLHFDAPDGPPFSVSRDEVNDLYAKAGEIRQLTSLDAQADVPEVIARGASFVHEQVYAVTFGQP